MLHAMALGSQLTGSTGIGQVRPAHGITAGHERLEAYLAEINWSTRPEEHFISAKQVTKQQW